MQEESQLLGFVGNEVMVVEHIEATRYISQAHDGKVFPCHSETSDVLVKVC